MKQNVWTRLTDEDIAAIDRIASALSATRSAAICLAVERYLEGDKTVPENSAHGSTVWTRIENRDVVALDAIAQEYDGITRLDLIAHACQQLIAKM